MLPLELFRNRNFSAVNAATFTIYGGLGAFTFYLVLYLQQIGGYSALGAGVALVPVMLIMFALSRWFGRLAMRIGPRLPMTAGPLVGAAGLLLLAHVGRSPSYVSDILPGVSLFALGLSATVAPLTATVLSSVEQHHAGIASGVNNAVARVAGLVAIAVVGALVSARFAAALDHRLPQPALDTARSRPLVTKVPAPVPPGQRAEARAALADAGVSAFHTGLAVSAVLVALGGVISVAGVRNPQAAQASSRRASAVRISSRT